MVCEVTSQTNERVLIDWQLKKIPVVIKNKNVWRVDLRIIIFLLKHILSIAIITYYFSSISVCY
jgi:hypothetical protein